MTWMHQAVHVARKDVTHARTPLIVYAIVVGIALLTAMSLPIRAEDTTLLTTAVMVLLLFGMILGASAVQADSPTQSTAFWASRPFQPTAMLGAKLLYCGALVVGIPLVAELGGLLHYDASTTTIVRDLLHSAGVYGLLLLATIIVASLTSDIRGFIVGALVIFAGLMTLVALFAIIGSTWGPFDFSFGTIGTWMLRVVGVVGSVALLIWLYRRRDVSRAAWVGAVMIVSACVWVLVDVSMSGIDGSPAKNSANAPTVVIEDARLTYPRGNEQPSIALRFTLPSPKAMERVSLTVRKVNVRLHDGTVVTSDPSWEPLTFDSPGWVLPAGIQAFGSAAGPTSVGTSIRLRDEDRARISTIGIAGVDVEAVMNIFAGQQIATGTFGSSTNSVFAGTRVQIGTGRAASIPYAIDVLTASVENARGITNPPTSVTIINDRTREGLVLETQRYGGSSSWMVLPGAPLWTARLSFNTRRPRESSRTYQTFSTTASTAMVEHIETNVTSSAERFPDPSWYAGTKINVIQWLPRAQQDIRVSKSLN